MTQIRSTVESLLDAVTLISQFSNTTKSATQAQSSVVLRFGADGLYVECTDGFTVASSAAVAIVPIGFEPGAAIAVHIGKLKELLGVMSLSQLDLEIEDHEDTRHESKQDTRLDARLRSTVDRQRFDLYGMRISGELMPVRGDDHQMCRFNITAERLLDLLGIGLACAATRKDAVSHLGSVHFTQEDGERLAMSATDGYKAGTSARSITGWVGKDTQFSIEASDAKRLATILRGFDPDEVIEVRAWGKGKRPERLILDFAWGLLIDMPAVNTHQPDINELIDQNTFDRPLKMTGADLQEALKATKIFSEGRRVRLNSDPRGYWWSSDNLEGDIAYMIDIDELDEHAGTPVDIHLDHKFIGDFLKATRAPVYSLFYQGTKAAVLVHPSDDDRDRMMMMPMIVNRAEAVEGVEADEQ